MNKRADGEGSIYQTKDNKWRAYIRMPDGKPKYFSGKTKRAVTDRLNAAKKAQEQGVDLAAPSQPTSQYLDHWLMDHKRERVRPSTYDHYALQVERAKRHLGNVPLDKLQPSHLDHCYARLKADGLSPRSVQMVHAVLRMALRLAYRRGMIPRVPTELATPPRPPYQEMKYLQAEQAQRLLVHTAEDRLSALWTLLVTVGLRFGEAAGLRWCDVDFDASTVAVRQTVQRLKGRGLVFGEPKTALSRRTIQLPAVTAHALRSHRARQLPERLAAGPAWQPHDLVFCTETGGPLDTGFVRQALHRALDHAGLPRIRTHDLRHTAATLLREQGTDMRDLQELLGHSSYTVTANTYSHVTPRGRREMAERMDALFSGLREAK